MHSSSSSSSSLSSLSSLIQYAFFAAIVYILAGAPLSSLISDASSASTQRDGNIGQEKLENLVIPEKNLTCVNHAYKGVYVLGREPLVVYIEGFLSDEEASHVVDTRFV
jgi:prolyl 4-hydroxylase